MDRNYEKGGKTKWNVCVGFVICAVIGISTLMLNGCSKQSSETENNKIENVANNQNDKATDESDTTAVIEISSVEMLEKKDVKLVGYGSINKKYIVDFKDDNEGSRESFCIDENMYDTFDCLYDYNSYIKFNIRYVQNPDGDRVSKLVDYSVFNSETGEEIVSFKNESELRAKLGLDSDEGDSIQSMENTISDEEAILAIKNYCYDKNPDLKDIEEAGEYPVNWTVVSSDENEIVVLFRSYTAAQIRYYINPITGDTYVTEYVDGITEQEERTDENFNVRDYL